MDRLHRPFPWKPIFWLAACTLALLLLWPAFTLLYVATDNETDHARPSDVIIVFGCPSYEGNVTSTTYTQTSSTGQT